jgi:hypothetical protein
MDIQNYNDEELVVYNFYKSINLSKPIDISEKIINSIIYSIPIAFLKFGDGEYNCIMNPNGCNCDKDNYTYKLSNSLRNAFINITNNNNNSYYIGKWNNRKVIDDYINISNNNNINYADYHTFIMLGQSHMEGYLDKKKIKIYETIKISKIKKIMVCNSSMIKAQKLLDIDYMIFIPVNNWFDDQFENVLNNVSEIINNNNGEPHIILTCCGMSAKVLIYELSKKYDNSLYFDIGSALDYLCNEDIRGYKNLYSYEYLLDLFKEVIPENWNYI